jgi:hypothetical protein
MKTRISAIVCLLCAFGYADLSRAEDPSSQQDDDRAYGSADLPDMSSGTPELYVSILAGYAMPRREDATFTDGTTPTVVKNVNYDQKYSIGGNVGIWFPTRNKLSGFDLGVELTGFLWHPDVSCCVDYFNNDPTGLKNSSGQANQGTTTMIQGLYIGPNLMIRYPMGISETYPNGRWFPYVGIGVGMHQMAMRPGGSRGLSTCCVPGGNLDTNAFPDQRDTTVGVMGTGGIKGHLFKYVAVFAEAKYIHAHHTGLLTDRFGNSGFIGAPLTGGSPLVLNQYSSNIDTILVHAGVSIHFDIRP